MKLIFPLGHCHTSSSAVSTTTHQRQTPLRQYSPRRYPYRILHLGVLNGRFEANARPAQSIRNFQTTPVRAYSPRHWRPSVRLHQPRFCVSCNRPSIQVHQPRDWTSRCQPRQRLLRQHSLDCLGPRQPEANVSRLFSEVVA